MPPVVRAFPGTAVQYAPGVTLIPVGSLVAQASSLVTSLRKHTGWKPVPIKGEQQNCGRQQFVSSPALKAPVRPAQGNALGNKYIQRSSALSGQRVKRSVRQIAFIDFELVQLK